MRQKWLKCLKEQEQGVSLLELVIAISIFSIAALVLMQGFVQAGKVNQKSEKYMEASNLAQNIMEVIKSKSLGEVSAAFNYPIDKASGESRFSFLEGKESIINQEDGIKIQELIKNSSDELEPVKTYKANVVDETKMTSSTLSKDDGKTWSFVPRTSGKNSSKYYFEMRNVEVNGKEFDVLVTYDGSNSSNYKKDDTDYSASDKKNDFVAPSIEKINTDEDAFLMMQQNWDKESVIEKMIKRQYDYAISLWNSNNKQGDEPQELDYDEVWKHTKRKLVVSIKEEKGITKASAHYYLDASNYSDGTTYGRMDLQQGDASVSQETNFAYLESLESTFFSTETGKSLDNLYIFYYPNYDCTNEGILDEIVIQNEQNLPVNVYIVKQSRMTETGTKVPSQQQEEQYKMKLTIEETPSSNGNSNWFTNTGIFRSQIRLLTNLNTDISEEDVSKRASVSQMTLGYSDSKTGRTIYGKVAQTILRLNGIDNQEAKDRIYDITVEVYPKGAGAHGYIGETPIITWNTSKDN